MKHCIVNFSDLHFKRCQDRLVQSLKNNNYQGDIITFNSFEQVGSKSHLEVPYQFKVYAIEKSRQMGYDIVLYCDSSLYAIKNVMPCIHHIIEKGCLMEYCGYSAGHFSTDECLNVFNISRDDAMKIKLHSAGFTGLNFTNEISKLFFEEWYKMAKQEISFKGDWVNNNNQCSQDSRCLGHRHDQTVASIIAHNLNLPRQNPYYMQYVYDHTIINENTIFGCRGC